MTSEIPSSDEYKAKVSKSPTEFAAALLSLETTPSTLDLSFLLREVDTDQPNLDGLSLKLQWSWGESLFTRELVGSVSSAPVPFDLGDELKGTSDKTTSVLLAKGGRIKEIHVIISEDEENMGPGFNRFRQQVLPMLLDAGYAPSHGFLIIGSDLEKYMVSADIQYSYDGHLELEFRRSLTSHQNSITLMKWWQELQSL